MNIFFFFDIKYLERKYNFIHFKLEYQIQFQEIKIFIKFANVNEKKLIKLKYIFEKGLNMFLVT